MGELFPGEVYPNLYQLLMDYPARAHESAKELLANLEAAEIPLLPGAGKPPEATQPTEELKASAPAHGWTCFHCSETLLTHADALDHFGHDQMSDPACRIKDGDERRILAALRSTQAELETVRQQRDRSDDDAESAAANLADLIRLVPGAKSSYDVSCEIESLRGRVMAAESILAEVGAQSRRLYQSACVAVCGPGTYYPPTQHARPTEAA